MDHNSIKGTSRRLVVELVIVAATSYRSRLPNGESYTQAWSFVGRHPLLIVHVAIGAVILAEATLLAVRCLRAGQTRWSVLALIGLVLVALAFVAGDRFLATDRSAVLDLMGIGWFAALVTYGVGWYLGGRKQVATASK